MTKLGIVFGVLAPLMLVSVILAVTVGRRVGWASPLSAGMWLWVVTFAFAFLLPPGFPAVGGRAAAILACGLIGLTLPALRARDYATPALPARPAGSPVPLLFAALVLTVMVAVSYVKFRAQIAAAYGDSFVTLSDTQIRAAQTGVARGGGFAAACQAATPVLACVGVYGHARYSRMWLAAVLVAFYATASTPARLPVVALIVVTLTFYLYCRRAYPRPRSGRSRGWLLAAAVGVGAIYFFVHGGQSTGKNALTLTYYPDHFGPDWLLSPLVYISGGVSALSATLTNGVNPFDRYNSVYSLAKLGHALHLGSPIPNTLARSTRVPAPFNVYTGFGQVYFDFGLVGVLLAAALLGWVAVVAHRKALAGRIEWAWVSATVAGLLLTTQQAYRLFFLDIDFQLALGFAVFTLLLRAKPRRPRRRQAAPRAVPVSPVHSTPAPVPVEELNSGVAAGARNHCPSAFSIEIRDVPQ